MKVTSQTLENRQVALTIEVEDERVQPALQRAAKRIANTVNIPGFRKGKAPYQVVLRAVGENALYKEMLDEIGDQVFREALEQSDLDLYGPGQLDDIQFKPLVLKATVPLRPIVELGDYRSLRVPFTVPEVPDAAVDEALSGLQERYAIVEPAGAGPVEWNQVAVLTIDGRLGPEENAPAIMHEHSVSILVAETTDFPFPGFIPNIVGMQVGEKKSFEIVLPDDFDDQELRGKTVHFRVELEDLKARHVPPLDDALAQTVGEYETLAALRESMRAGLLQRATGEAESRYANLCLQKLIEQAHIEFPPPLVEKELDDLIEHSKQRLSEQKMSLDEFLNIKKQSLEEYRNEMRPRAESNVRSALALASFVERERLQVTEEDVTRVQQVIEAYNKNVGQARSGLSSDEVERSITNELFTARVLGRLVSICKGENPPLPATDEPVPSDRPPAAE